MRKLLILVLFVSGIALVATANTWKYFSTRQTQNDNAPTDAGDGLNIAYATAYRVVVSAPPGRILTDGGITCYFKAPSSADWIPCDPGLNIDLPGGQREYVSPDYVSGVGIGRLKYVTSAVDLLLSDGGPNTADAGFVDVTIEGRFK